MNPKVAAPETYAPPLSWRSEKTSLLDAPPWPGLAAPAPPASCPPPAEPPAAAAPAPVARPRRARAARQLPAAWPEDYSPTGRRLIAFFDRVLSGEGAE